MGETQKPTETQHADPRVNGATGVGTRSLFLWSISVIHHSWPKLPRQKADLSLTFTLTVTWAVGTNAAGLDSCLRLLCSPKMGHYTLQPNHNPQHRDKHENSTSINSSLLPKPNSDPSSKSQLSSSPKSTTSPRHSPNIRPRPTCQRSSSQVSFYVQLELSELRCLVVLGFKCQTCLSFAEEWNLRTYLSSFCRKLEKKEKKRQWRSWFVVEV